MQFISVLLLCRQNSQEPSGYYPTVPRWINQLHVQRIIRHFGIHATVPKQYRPVLTFLDDQRVHPRCELAVTGRVETTPPYFDKSSVAIAPLRLARGVQNKVLEAMSMALPTVASPQASQGLGSVPERALTVADGAEQTIEGVSKWFADPERARQDGLAAASWVRDTWRWERMYERLDAILDDVGVSFG